MSRSYDVEIVIGEKIGFNLLCFEDDDCIWEGFFKNSDDAHKVGKKFLKGLFVDGFDYSDA